MAYSISKVKILRFNTLVLYKNKTPIGALNFKSPYQATIHLSDNAATKNITPDSKEWKFLKSRTFGLGNKILITQKFKTLREAFENAVMCCKVIFKRKVSVKRHEHTTF